MMNPERGKLIPVSGNNNTPDMDNAVDVQFNPVSLKVSLSNTLKENKRNGNSRAAQFVDKSSSTLSVELMFDTTYIDAGDGESQNDIEQGSDVRDQTKKIAERFLKPVESGEQMEAPKRCLFQWGSFEFVGMVENYEETLDYFSKEGRPLRAKVVLRLKEDRYQFRQRSDGVAAAQQDTPTLSPTGNGDTGTNQHTSPVPGASEGPGNWRDTALYNGIENPRLPGAAVLAVPGVSAKASVGIKAGGGAAIGVKTSFSAQPAFSFGASASLGTRVEGAFGAGARAGAVLGAGIETGAEGPALELDAGVGFD
ncbi:hypothetical protein GCM10011348_02930 [Marinobacterium nitratireducens]|uniref:Contractile injection system tube protein N-terminal domain-containing protein n=1 Tax=Marinobacterium nitratireducens TaxID=518897 RepID=A0A917Z684_9GAMM|nr:hypothetical protein [Marinobacterium nitratireducens]GGO76227.1 hypothetical protein GCM10011348_02930 [Marinobacterium nitratireducens]